MAPVMESDMVETAWHGRDEDEAVCGVMVLGSAKGSGLALGCLVRMGSHA